MDSGSGLLGAGSGPVLVDGIGVPLFYAVLLSRQRAWSLGPALNFLTVGFKTHARLWELLEVGKKLLFTGFLALVAPGLLPWQQG